MADEKLKKQGGEVELRIDDHVVGNLPILSYIPEFITESEQSQLLHRVYEVPGSKWKTLKNRRFQNWDCECFREIETTRGDIQGGLKTVIALIELYGRKKKKTKAIQTVGLCLAGSKRHETISQTSPPPHQTLDLLCRGRLKLLNIVQWPRGLAPIRRALSLNAAFFSTALTALSSLPPIQSPNLLHQLHALLITSGLSCSPFFSGKLIAHYSRFRNLTAALSAFLAGPQDNVFLWNSLIRAQTHNGKFSEALQCYYRMQERKIVPDAFTFPSVLNACAGIGVLGIGRKVHKHVLKMGFEKDLYVGNSLIDMYARLGCLADALEVFDGMPKRDLVTWNSLICGYSANGKWERAVEMFGKLRMSGVVPDCFTVESVLPAFGWLGEVGEGCVVHGIVCKIGIDKDRLVNNGLIAMYSKLEKLVNARELFDMMVGKDVVSWNTMVDGYYQVGCYQKAIELFQEMLLSSYPDLVTITTILHVCHDMEDLKLGRSVHGYILRNGYQCDVAANNAMLVMYSRCGSLNMSRIVFEHMLHRDVASWNSLIIGYVEKRHFDEVKGLFRLMKESEIGPDVVSMMTLLTMCTELLDLRQGKVFHCEAFKTGVHSNLVLQNAVISMYSKCDSLDDALKKFRSMQSHDTVTWNSIISGCVQNGACDLGFSLLREMNLCGTKMDMATILSVLPACSFLAAKKQGKEIHGAIFKLGLESDIPIGNALIEMYSKCGNLGYGVCVFEHMNSKDIVTWTSLVSAYGMYGQGEKALRAFKQMEGTGIAPDHIAFVAVLFACSHAGLVEEGKLYFRKMRLDYKIAPSMEHYACMVDLLSRSGKLIEAEKFIEAMPIEPDASIWGALLSACRIAGQNKIAERVSRRIIDLNSDNAGYYVLASNVYASMGRWDAVGNIRKSLKARNLKKDPGCSWIEIKNKIYVFGAGDLLMQQSKEIYQLLEILAELMAKEGYVPDKNFVLQNVEEDDKGHMLCAHSERLALAFGLLNTPPGMPLQIMKNLRVCRDCHIATKYISKIARRELLVRDANRFHLFKDGVCSCGDYW